MIYYFSGTGNSRYVAQRISKALGTKAFCIAIGAKPQIPDNEEPIGFVCPTYFWGIPWLMSDFLQSLHLSGDHYLFLVLTCGGSTGNASGMLEKKLGRKMDAKFSVKMPDTWTPMFDVSNQAENMALIEKADADIDQIIKLITNKEQGDFDRLRGMGKIATTLIYPFYRKQSAKKFSVTSYCISCGQCEERCPIHSISMEKGRPVWNIDHCLFCLSCLHRCPANAITYGPNTHKHGQFYNPKVEQNGD